MKGKKLGFLFTVFVMLILLILGMILGYRIKNDISENGLCWSPSITYNETQHDYDICIIQPPEGG